MTDHQDVHETENTQSNWNSMLESNTTPLPNTLTLTLEITDPETVAAVNDYPEGRVRDEFVKTALRIGTLALLKARGQIDTETVRNEGERLIAEVGRELQAHRESVKSTVTDKLAEYFNPESGRLDERLNRLLKQDGDLERILRDHIGTKDSELTRTLVKHIGESSPILKALDPNTSTGFLQTLRESVDASLKIQRDKIVGQFSLDDKASALSRLVKELSERNGEMNSNLRESMKEVVGEFSLDDENSALSRLVRKIDDAQGKISSELSLDIENSGLSRMKTELLGVMEIYKRDNTEFQQEVRKALQTMQIRREESKRSTSHGNDFEHELYLELQKLAQRQGDIVTAVGSTTGLIKHCKKGDVLIELGGECVAAGSKIIIEAKQDASYGLGKARIEIDQARRNREAEVGIFIFSRRTAPDGLDAFIRHNADLFVIWDATDATTDIYLEAALSVARALSSRTARERAKVKTDFVAIDRAIREIEVQSQNLDKIETYTQTIKASGDKVIHRVRIMKASLNEQIKVIDQGFSELKANRVGPQD